jgi:type I restriction enzyme S subunit
MQPRLRFREFSDNWEEKKLGDIGENIIGLTYSPEDITHDDSFPIVLRSSNIQNDRLDLIDTVRVKTSIPKKLFVQDGDILICTRNGSKRLIGKNIRLIITDNPIVFGAFMSIFRSPNNNFVEHLFRTEKYHEQIQVNLGATINQITTGNLNKFLFSFPCPEEQTKIASFLSAVDEKITQLTKKHELLTQYKKGVMQKIFSQELRFNDEDGSDYPDWVSKKIGEVLTIGSGKDYKHLTVGDIPVFGTGGYMLSVNEYLYDGDSVGIGRKGTIDKPVLLTGKFWTVDTLFYTHSFKECLPKFIYYVFLGINWKSHSEASGVPSLSKSIIEKLPIFLPTIPEQTKVTNFLSAIDDKIQNNQSQLEATKQYKQGLLQQMFV